MTAHVLTGSPVPLAAQWAAAILLFAGGLAALTLRSRPLRLLAAGLAICGASGTVIAWLLAAAQPGAAPYAVRIVEPTSGASVASPLTLTVCGVRSDGRTLPATDAAHYLVVFVDGREVSTVDTWQFVEQLSAGTHAVRVELVTPAHHAFSPPATDVVTVHVTRAHPPLPSGAC